MSRRPLVAIAALFVASVLGSSALAGDGGTNLRMYPGMLADLRSAFLRVHDPQHHHVLEWKGPLLGYSCQRTVDDPTATCARFHVFYARYHGEEYAAATVWDNHSGGTDQPEQFKRAVGGRWRDIGDGFPPECGVPAPVAKVWAWPRCG